MTRRAPACWPPGVLGPTGDRLAQLASDSRAQEFAADAGRVAIPRSPGVPVAGIELSGPMTEQLRTKTGETSILVIAADMATWTPGRDVI